MVESPWLTAALWMGLALAASLISIRIGISIALIEICVGAVAGNTVGLERTEWVNFLAGLGSVLLTFLAGAEIEPDALRRQWKPALAIGAVSFLAPFLGAMAFAHYVLHWDANASKIAGIALSTTSVAVVYAVMLETKLNEKDFGKLILAACFITDLGTVLALGVLFANWNWWLAAFLGASTVCLVFVPRLADLFLRKFDGQVSEPELKLLLLLLLVLGGLATKANSEAVLPAYVLGLMVAGVLAQHREAVRHLRVATFALLTPFYFLKAGALIEWRALVGGLAAIGLLLAVKVTAKGVGVYPVARYFKMDRSSAGYTTLLMSTGLTFGTISAMFGMNRNLITPAQYSILVTVVIASAVIPTIIAQKHFQPKLKVLAVQSEDEVLLAENGGSAETVSAGDVPGEARG